MNPGVDLGIRWFWWGGCSGYAAAVSGIGVLSRSKARRWSGVGSASMGTSMLVWWEEADLVAGQGGQVVE